MSKPITPDEVAKLKPTTIPAAVFDVFNECIAQAWTGRSARVYQKDVVAACVAKGLDRSDLFEKHWLDVEEIYRAAGWLVSYDKPGYNEDYEPVFIFSKRK